MQQHSSIPYSFFHLISNEPQEKVSLKDSVLQHIQLIIRTKPGTYALDPKYGCAINLYEFEVPRFRKMTKKWEERLRKELLESLEYSLENFEPRIQDVTIRLEEFEPDIATKEVKKMIKVYFKGQFINEENFQFMEVVKLSYKSLD